MPVSSNSRIKKSENRLETTKNSAKKGRRNSKWRLFLLWAFAIAVILTFGLAQFDGQTLWSQVQRFSWSAIAVSLCTVLLQIFCQTARLWLLFPRAAQLSWRKAAIAFIRGQFIGSWVSTQAGYAVKIWHVKPGQTKDFSLVTATAVILLDKLLDIFLLLGLAIAGGLWLLQSDYVNSPGAQMRPEGLFSILNMRPHAWWILTSLLLAVLCIIGWLLIHPSPRVERFRSQISQALEFLKSPPQILGAALMGTGDWIFEMLSLQILCSALGESLNLAQASICLFILNLGISIPSGIANVGAFEAALTFALLQFGMSLEQSLATAVVYHILQLVGITAWYLTTSFWRRGSRTIALHNSNSSG